MTARLLGWLLAVHIAALVAGIVVVSAADVVEGWVVAALVSAVATSFVGAAALGLVAVSHLQRIAAAAIHVESGDLQPRLDLGGSVPELAASFNSLVASLRDRLEDAAQERRRLEGVLNSSIDAVMAVDADGKITFANAAAERLFDRSNADLVGNPFGWVVAEEQAVEALRASRERGEAQRAISERPNHRFLQVVTTPIAGGGDWAALAMFHDVTDVKRTEQVRRDFIANVSHELRTPLASIKSLIETLEAGALEEPETAKDFLMRANQEVDRLVRLVEELLELSRIESGGVPLTREPVDLVAVIDGAVDRLRPQAALKGVDILWSVHELVPPIEGDAERLERVVVNLLLNALKFTPAEGTVHVEVRSRDGAVSVDVRDNGAGIAAEDLPRVFERFYKADRARGSTGTGLGLAIVKHTVELHGGHITAESVEGRGATFSVTLPALSSPPQT